MIFGLDVIIFFALLSLCAAMVNGGLGYGYSSVSAPIALLVFINRIINPAYVLLEAFVNTAMLFFSGKKNIAATARRSLPIAAAIIPGVIVGSIALSVVAPLWIRLIVYAAILPLILLQAAGIRRPIKRETSAGITLGLGTGMIYSITTISGPPIALFWNNQGMNQEEFRASITQVRLIESYAACIAYYFLGLFSMSSIQLFGIISPFAFIGLPIGIFIVRRLSAETFKRVCMAFNALIVGFGLSQTLMGLFALPSNLAYSFWFVVIGIDGYVLYNYFTEKRKKVVELDTGGRPAVVPLIASLEKEKEPTISPAR